MATLLIVEDDHKTNDAICEYLRPPDRRRLRAVVCPADGLLRWAGRHGLAGDQGQEKDNG